MKKGALKGKRGGGGELKCRESGQRNKTVIHKAPGVWSGNLNYLMKHLLRIQRGHICTFPPTRFNLLILF